MTSLTTPRPVQFPAPRFIPNGVRQITDVFSSGYSPMLGVAVQPCLWVDPTALTEGRYIGPDFISGWDQPVRWTAESANLHIKGAGQAETVVFNNKPVIVFGDKRCDMRIHARMPAAYTMFMVQSFDSSEYSGALHSLLAEGLDERAGLSTVFWEWNAPPIGTTGLVLFNPNISGSGGSSTMDGTFVSAADTPQILAVSYDGGSPTGTSKQYVNNNTVRVTKSDHGPAPVNGDLSLYFGSRVYLMSQDDPRGLKGRIGAFIMYPAVLSDADVGTVMNGLKAMFGIA